MKEFTEIEFSNRTGPIEIKDVSRSRRRSISSLTNSITPCAPEAVQLDVEASSAIKQNNEERSQANKMISTINLAQEATAEIGRLVKSVDGIAQQVESGNISKQRREVLESEANDLVSEIKRKAYSSSESIKPLADDDKIKAEIERKLGKTLDDLLPNKDDEIFDIGEIKLDLKENIVNARASVARVQERVEKIQANIKEATKEIQSLITTIDVASQNTEASQVSIRDLDNALSVAVETGDLIERSPEEALQSAGALSHFSVNVLVNNDENV